MTKRFSADFENSGSFDSFELERCAEADTRRSRPGFEGPARCCASVTPVIGCATGFDSSRVKGASLPVRPLLEELYRLHGAADLANA